MTTVSVSSVTWTRAVDAAEAALSDLHHYNNDAAQDRLLVMNAVRRALVALDIRVEVES